MSATAAQDILCNQCTAPLTIDQGASLVVCQFCETTNHLDRSKIILHYAVAPTLSDSAAEAALRRWMAGNDTVKGLDKEADIPPPQYELIPMWMIRSKRDGQESVFLEPAVAVVVSELKNMSIPAANL